MAHTARRRLSAILHADVVGFSRLMSEDDVATHAALRARLEDAARVVRARGGRIVSVAGDAFLAVFPSVLAAVEAGVAIQQGGGATDMADASADGADEARDAPMLFRVGVHLGDVIEDGDDVYGDGVNIAARVQALAEPGGVSVTEAVREQVSRRSGFVFEDQGVQRLKNIAAPVRVFALRSRASPATRLRIGRRALAALGALALLVGAASFLILQQGPDPAETAAKSGEDGKPLVAVLPFDDLSPDPAGDYFSAGVTEDVIAQLGRFPELLVLSWNAVAPYRDAAPARLAEALGARYVVGGSIRRGAERIRVAVELSDAERGLLLWSARYDEPAEDIFVVQDRLSRAVVEQLAVRLGRLEQDRALTAPRERLGAYEFVLRGRDALRRTKRAANLRARALFEQALTLDDRFAAAYVGLGWTHSADVLWGWSHDPPRSLDRAEALARRALALDPDQADAHALIANIFRISGRLEEAEREIGRALALNPNNPRSRAIHGTVLLYQGLIAAAIVELELARRLDPALPIWMKSNLAQAYYLDRRFDAAVRTLEASEMSAAEDVAPYAILAASLAQTGRTEAAREAAAAVRRLYPFFDARAFAESVSGAADGALILDGLRKAGL